MAMIFVSHRFPSMVSIVVGILSLLVLIQNGDAHEYKVGGSGDWSLTSTSHNQWADKSLFQVGDSLCEFLHFPSIQYHLY